MKKLISLADIPHQLDVEELLDVKGGDGTSDTCEKGVSAVPCKIETLGRPIECSTIGIKLCKKTAAISEKVDAPDGGNVDTCEVESSK